MPQSWPVSRSRFVMMQVVMWLVLGGAVSLASLLDFGLDRSRQIPLGNPMSLGGLTFRPPSNWKATTGIGEGGAAIFTAVQSTTQGGRTLTVVSQTVDRLMSPIEYLVFSGQLGDELKVLDSEPKTIAGWPGQIFQIARRSTGDAGPVVQEIACLVLPNRQAAVVRLEVPATFTSIDHHVLSEEIVGAISIAGPERGTSGAIQLGDGATISMPDDFSACDEIDDLRRARTVLCRQNDEQGWAWAQFVPVMLVGDSPADILRQSIAAREHLNQGDVEHTERWLTAQISSVGPGRWMIDPHDLPNESLQRRAYVVAGKGDYGILAAITGIELTSQGLDKIWTQLADRIQPGDGPSLSNLMSAGARAIARLAPLPPGDRYWMWLNKGAPAGWTLDYHDPSSMYPSRETRRRTWQGSVSRLRQSWDLTNTRGAPQAVIRREDADSTTNGLFEFRFSESILAGNPIQTTMAGSRNLRPTQFPRLPGYVMGAHLPALLSNISDERLALWTDRVPGEEVELYTSPILLLVHRLSSPDADPRCVEVQVNGTGRASRWYFKRDGTLDHADFAGEMRLQPTSSDEIKSTFGSDPLLTR